MQHKIKKSCFCSRRHWFALLVSLLFISLPTWAAEVESIDWSSVPTSKPRLFYPGQSSYEWLRIEDHKKASNEVKDGEACLKCHKSEQKSLGEILVVENRLEPDPIEDKDGYKRLSVQVAHDDTNLYMRFSWKSDGDGVGDQGNYMRFDGEQWQWYGNHRQHETVIDDEQPAIYPDRLGIMMGDGRVPLYPEQGCWMTCHESMIGMEEEADEDEVAEHPVISQLYKAFGVVNRSVRKYIPASRSEGTDWAAVKSADELADLRQQGAFLDLIIWDAALTNPGGFAADFNVLEIKQVDAGNSALLPNGKMLGGPEFMFDAAKVGFSVLTEQDLSDQDKPKHLVIGTTAAALDGDFNEGDILPAHIVDTGAAEGSAADVDYAKGEWSDGTYTLTLRRKLDSGHPLDDLIMQPGGVYTFGFSIHDDAAGKRAHHVSFPVRVSIGPGKADIQAVTLK
ncbi:MAG: ethylbenzene dehydrogenase-related protein [Halopseudomonas sp.]